MNTICIIPARGGSRRILKKNIKDFLGKPAIQYSIDAALSTNLFDEIFVSTDDPEIAQNFNKIRSGSRIYYEVKKLLMIMPPQLMLFTRF